MLNAKKTNTFIGGCYRENREPHQALGRFGCVSYLGIMCLAINYL
jgi:hypothetical protein